MARIRKMQNTEIPYNNLKSFIKDKDLTILEKRDFLVGISKLDKEGQEKFHGLVLKYHEEYGNDEEDSDFPYNSTVESDSVTYNMLNFPLGLRQLLFKFVRLHLEHIERTRLLP